ncbi:hypothetical protein A2331_02735 [Candidatus Falkowbacteria bacterium RIFOXYB2_FULL_34_18]|uniref:Glycosyltransferase 2-like domain-containing protein n=1 Tax=Candidatus Falkowbacteria bacterium RIFOXYD2_FULL_34_120 TaxID=1798007 RepID=A0A1F5TRT8_9BACT|nr:MAG: hypothetical protein A2331_02735 [Candidatus Falkowbacteria bacterium RIFOXYB2_FULL_34_18]OGF29656.1 MAG: hypothetical protein A2500_00765 [Candidatus Falkowbacteria bacterium RIFOXYC12_FULL_34_55]OGF37383.1 MAG: hypothetical protein A2466_01535 [Candidatus Falkowbacteria bacterium RIFOXYC2_FULL_34_220]OGF39121.1 MAG: hypothetical protein A2515_00185 [Candidatus Falkowbacteria bacterium RIFOXYD12_FULL_34_57]OGF41645.1 MAG: hypothetical protein A2531_06420 [Candidatus Falkowbacteria bact
MKASACIIVYNHEKYIRECLDSALSQKVNFDYEIVVCEDKSTDNTREIVKEYANKYPDKIKLYLNETNLGLIGNWEKSMKSCQGEYIAICEGDDYWTDPYKIQKQVDFMEQNQDYTLTVHNSIVVDEKSKFIRNQCNKDKDETIPTEELIGGKFFATCSIVFKKEILNTLPDWFFTLEACDWTLPAFCAAHGKTKYFKEKMSAYRKHKKGAAFNQKIKIESEGKDFFRFVEDSALYTSDILNKHFNYKYDKQLRRQKIYWYNDLVDKYLRINDIQNTRKYAGIVLKETIILNHWKNGWLTYKRFIKLILIFLFPKIFIKK